MGKRIIFTILVSFAISVLVAPFVIKYLKKQKAKQTILHYVKEHEQKQGTPTMGGFIFLIAIAITCAIFVRGSKILTIMTLSVTFAYALLGFLDDFIKIRFKQNMGLRAYQKLIFQFAVAILISIFVCKSGLIGTELIIPFTTTTIDISWWIIPLTILVFIGCTNSVNLTDGLDGLASKVTIVYVSFFVVLTIILTKNLQIDYQIEEYKNMIIFGCATIGGLLGFLCFNTYPAKIFMGDMGSMALGAIVACVGIFIKASLFIPIAGIMYVLTALSDIIQVAYYKKTGKRVFLMAPLHHHYQMKGVHETKIGVLYSIITIVFCAITLAFQF